MKTAFTKWGREKEQEGGGSEETVEQEAAGRLSLIDKAKKQGYVQKGTLAYCITHNVQHCILTVFENSKWNKTLDS